MASDRQRTDRPGGVVPAAGGPVAHDGADAGDGTNGSVPADHAPWVTHRGGCHCRRVRFAVDAPAHLRVLDCNCSICRMTGYWHLIVPAGRFRLLAGADALTEYSFNTGAARHRFCRFCGVKSFYVPRSHPDGIDVNARCLDAGTVTGIDIEPFDDGDRDAATAALAHLTRE